MTIRDVDLFVSRIWDWAFLDECFAGTLIKVGDVDGIIERNGRFLLIETKGEGVPIPKGQRILFEALHRVGVFHILVLWGETNAPAQFQLWGHDPKDCTRADVVRLVTRWFLWANSNPGSVVQ